MGDAPHDTAEQPWRTAIASMERQVERGSLFTHTVLSETAERVTEVETFLYGLVDVLVANKVINQDALGRAAATIRDELDQRGETVLPGIALRVDAEVPADDFVPVNCAERMHVCHAWSDFESMQLNTAWIEENLHATGPRLAHATMVQLPDPVFRRGESADQFGS